MRLTDAELDRLACAGVEWGKDEPEILAIMRRAADELRESRRLDDRMREQLAFLDKAIAEGRFPGPPRAVCAHCQTEHDVESGAMAAHVRECDENPMADELRTYRAAVAALAEERREYQRSTIPTIWMVNAIDNCLAACGVEVLK